jgi:cysteine desulfurase / selenocysteine lyase
MGATLEILSRVGIDAISAHDRTLTAYMLEKLADIPGLRAYGALDLKQTPRTGVVSFNLEDLSHGLVATLLNDYHNVAVRNACFCAHPYVQSLISPELQLLNLPDDVEEAGKAVDLKRGMIRASLGLYSTRADIDALVSGLHDIQKNARRYQKEYYIDDNLDYFSEKFRSKPAFDVVSAVDRALMAEPVAVRAMRDTLPLATSSRLLTFP